jgi:hypothetical protein
LPDGLFSNQKIPIWVNFGGSFNGKCWYFYDHLEYFTAIWYILWQFVIVCGNLVYFSRFGMFGPRKIWQPCCNSRSSDWLQPVVVASIDAARCQHNKQTDFKVRSAQGTK